MRADAQANRQAILRAARELYVERGPNVPFNAVAERAGVGIATLYRRFPTPIDLKVGIARDMLTEITAVADAALTRMQDDPEAGWREFALGLGRMRLAALYPQMIADVDPDDPPAALVAVREGLFGAIQPVLDRAKEAGLVEPSVTLPQVHLGLAWVSRPLPPIALALVPTQQEWMVEVFLRGLRPDVS